MIPDTLLPDLQELMRRVTWVPRDDNAPVIKHRFKDDPLTRAIAIALSHVISPVLHRGRVYEDENGPYIILRSDGPPASEASIESEISIEPEIGDLIERAREKVLA